MHKPLLFALPKGSLEKATFALFEKAGFRLYAGARSYHPGSDDPEIEFVLYRPQEMPRYVEEGIVDAGLTGHDWVVENQAKVTLICNLTYAKQTNVPVRWVLAVHESSPVRTVKDLEGKKISTELVHVTRRYLARKRVKAEVEFSWGATEVKPPRLADAIVEVTETGSSLRANQLRIVDTVLESRTQLIANRKCVRDPWKRAKLENIALLLKGAILAQEKVGLKLNVHKKNLKALLKFLPALKTPTVSKLSDVDWYDVDTVIDEVLVRELIPKLKAAGAQGIIEYPLNKVIP